MRLSDSDARLLEASLPSLRFEELWDATDEARAHLREAVRRLIRACLFLECEATTTALAPHLVDLGISAAAAPTVAASVLDTFQTYLEATALSRVPTSRVQDLCDMVYGYYANPVDTADFVDAMRKRLGLGMLASLAVANLLFKQWRWNIWWRKPSQQIRSMFGDKWDTIAKQMVTIEAYGKQVAVELRWVFLMNEMESIKSEIESLKAQFPDSDAGPNEPS